MTQLSGASVALHDVVLSKDYGEYKSGDELSVDTNEKEALLSLDAIIETTKEMGISELSDSLEAIIKADRTNKVICFLGMLSAFTQSAAFNIAFRAPSSTGKSFIPLTLARVFPSENVIELAYTSPTSFFHDIGEWNAETKTNTLDYSNKILIFIDQPHDDLLKRLRPWLSHDKPELTHKITDKSEKKGLRTKTVILKGFPAVVFCTGRLRADEQESTRSFVLSPETSKEKIQAGILLTAKKKADPDAFEAETMKNPELNALRRRIEIIFSQKIQRIIVPDHEKIAERFQAQYPSPKPRHMRDITRVISLIQSLALLNCFHRNKDPEGNITATQTDIDQAFELYAEIAEPQEHGIPPYAYKILREIIEPEYNDHSGAGITRKEIALRHLKEYGRTISQRYLTDEVLAILESAGLINIEPNPNDKRTMLYHTVSENKSICQARVGGETNNTLTQSSTTSHTPLRHISFQSEELGEGHCSYCSQIVPQRTIGPNGNPICPNCKAEANQA